MTRIKLFKMSLFCKLIRISIYFEKIFHITLIYLLFKHNFNISEIKIELYHKEYMLDKEIEMKQKLLDQLRQQSSY